MTNYWNVISMKHQNKLRFQAKKHGVTTDCALRNIVNYLKSENHNASRPSYFREFVTAKDIEGVIDIVNC
jgi:hypothetical protein